VGGIYGIGAGSILAPVLIGTGARIQQRLPDTLILRLTGVLVVAIGARYLWSGPG
jgi:putative Ca2+/H+ antiporter (TMEM165/GDT1 family)